MSKFWREPLISLGLITENEPKDPGPGAADRGSGPEFQTAEEQNQEWDDHLETLGTLTLHPVVLAQLQRIADHVLSNSVRLERIEGMLRKDDG